MSIPDSLSQREKEVAALLMQGMSNKQIAQALGVSTRTVEFHLSHIYEKLEVDSRAEAILRLAQGHLRETTGAPAAPELRGLPAELRVPTVENAGDPSENETKFHFSIRRITLKKFVVILVLLSIACFALAVVGMLIFRFKPATVRSGVSQIIESQMNPTYTPWVTTPTGIQPTYTAVEKTPAPPEPAFTPIQRQGDGYLYEGVRFALPPTTNYRPGGRVLPENRGSADSPHWLIHPRYVNIALDNYPLAHPDFPTAISVYPVEEFSAFSPLAKKTINELREMLSTRPSALRTIPFLPVTNMGQVFNSNRKYLDFQNGSGARYLAMFAQAVTPVNSRDLVYTYQGLTSDGRYVVSVILPVSHTVLPFDADALPISEQTAIGNDYDTYRAETAALLEAQADNSFNPDLNTLDALVGSLLIE